MIEKQNSFDGESDPDLFMNSEEPPKKSKLMARLLKATTSENPASSFLNHKKLRRFESH